MTRPDLSAAWRRLDSKLAPVKLPDERAATDLYAPVHVEFLGERKRLVFPADRRLPRDCVHSLACAAELAADLVEPVSGTRAIAPSADATRDLGPTICAAETSVARTAEAVPSRQNESAEARSAASAVAISDVRVVEADDVARATAARAVGGRGSLGGGGLALIAVLLGGCAGTDAICIAGHFAALVLCWLCWRLIGCLQQSRAETHAANNRAQRVVGVCERAIRCAGTADLAAQLRRELQEALR